MVLLEEVLKKINALFDGEDFIPGQQRSWVEGLVTVLTEDTQLRTQAGANNAKQFMESPDLATAVHNAVLSDNDAAGRMVNKFFEDPQFQSGLVKLLGELVHDRLSQDAG